MVRSARCMGALRVKGLRYGPLFCERRLEDVQGSKQVKTVWAIAVTLSLTACLSTPGGVVQIANSADAQSTWLTDVPVEQVTTCLARAFDASAQQSNQTWLVADAMSGTTYRIGTVVDPLSRYSTRIDQIGQTTTDRPIRVSNCVVAVG